MLQVAPCKIPEISTGLEGFLARMQTLPRATTKDDSKVGNCTTYNHLSSSTLPYNKWLGSLLCLQNITKALTLASLLQLMK